MRKDWSNEQRPVDSTSHLVLKSMTAYRTSSTSHGNAVSVSLLFRRLYNDANVDGALDTE